MSRRRSARKSRDAPQARSGTQGNGAVILATDAGFRALCEDGYRPLSACPEVQMCVGVYADMIASMTIHLMRNTDKGDVRVRNALSRKIDIAPNRLMTHQQFFSNLVRVLMLHGNQVTLPVYRGGYLEDLQPLPPSQVSFTQTPDGYRILWQGEEIAPDEALHFVLNPDPEQPFRGLGYTVSLPELVRSLRQTNATKNALMRSPAPSVIVRVDGLNEELQSKAGRDRLAAQYVDDSGSGKPWFISAETFEVQQVKPLTLNDLAIKTSLELDKRSIAALMGVPAFTVGIGDFRADEYNWFVATRLMCVARIIQQELTRKTLYAPELYWRMNNRSLLNYDIDKLVSAGAQMVDRMALRRNEWRDWLGIPPDGEMEELLALENYVPADRLGDQAKLTGGDEG